MGAECFFAFSHITLKNSILNFSNLCSLEFLKFRLTEKVQKISKIFTQKFLPKNLELSKIIPTFDFGMREEPIPEF